MGRDLRKVTVSGSKILAVIGAMLICKKLDDHPWKKHDRIVALNFHHCMVDVQTYEVGISFSSHRRTSKSEVMNGQDL